MTKRLEAKHKLDRRMGQNIWGRPKSPIWRDWCKLPRANRAFYRFLSGRREPGIVARVDALCPDPFS